MLSYFKKIKGSLFALTFHGLVDLFPKYSMYPGTRGCHIYVKDFIRILEICSKHFCFARLSDVQTYLEGGGTRPAILLTFDDGLNSITELAAPILRKFSASALVFVNTSWIDSGESPAIFDLERQIYETVPVNIEIEVPGLQFQVNISNHRSIRQNLDDIWRFLLTNKVAPVTLKKKNFILNGKNWSSILTSGVDSLWMPTTWEKLRAYALDGTLEIGSHGVSHVPWPWLNDLDLKSELLTSKYRLQNELDANVTSCSYPHGISNGDSELAVSKFYCAGFGTTAGFISKECNLTNLPRFHVPSEWPNGLPWILEYRKVGRLLRKGNSILNSMLER